MGFEGRPFLNLVAGFDTEETVGVIDAVFREIEGAFGRERGPDKFSPRTLDIDLLTYGNRVGSIGGCVLPRDEILRYAFVLGPLAEVAGEDVHPVAKRSYLTLWDQFPKGPNALIPVPLDWDS